MKRTIITTAVIITLLSVFSDATFTCHQTLSCNGVIISTGKTTPEACCYPLEHGGVGANYYEDDTLTQNCMDCTPLNVGKYHCVQGAQPKCLGADQGTLDSQDECCIVSGGQPRAYIFADTGVCFVCDEDVGVNTFVCVESFDAVSGACDGNNLAIAESGDICCDSLGVGAYLDTTTGKCVQCPVDCEWDDWSDWGKCSVTCDGGTEFRARKSIPAQNDGKPCVGDSVETRLCTNDPCPMCPPTSDCSDLPGINGGVVMTNDPTCAQEAIAKYTCNEGYCPKGDTIRCCVDDGTGAGTFDWSGDPPTCVKECPDNLMDPENGCVVIAGNKPGDKAVYFCDYGFTLKGERKSECGEDGEWDGTPPSCDRMCPKLPYIPYGKVYTDGLKPGSTATYHCKYGYFLNGYKKRVCDEDGTWTYREPTCDKDDRKKYTPWKKSYSSGSRRKSSRSSSSRSTHKRYW